MTAGDWVSLIGLGMTIVGSAMYLEKRLTKIETQLRYQEEAFLRLNGVMTDWVALTRDAFATKKKKAAR